MAKALAEFQARVLDLEADFQFVALSAQLRPRLGVAINWSGTPEVVALAQAFMDAKASRIEGVFGGFLVRLLAVLERYTRLLIEEALEVHAKKAATYEKLTTHIVNRNTALTGMLLATIESPRDHPKIDFDALLNNLASCRAGNAAFRLNAQAFGATVIGVSAFTLEKGFANVGIKEWWDKLGANAALQKLLGTKGSRHTGKVARDRLEELWRRRNHLAHGGDDDVTMSEGELSDCIDFVRTFAVALDGVVLKST